MADATLYCKTCGDYKEHMHFKGPTCICSECGGNTAAPNWREIEADVEARKKANQAAVSKRNYPDRETKAPPAETKPATIETEPTKGETNMPKGKKLSDADKAVIIKERKAGAEVAELAKQFKVSTAAIYYTLSHAGKPEKAAKAPKATNPLKASPKPQEQASAAPLRGL